MMNEDFYNNIEEVKNNLIENFNKTKDVKLLKDIYYCLEITNKYTMNNFFDDIYNKVNSLDENTLENIVNKLKDYEKEMN